MPLPTGTRLGPYEIVAPLGAGGMGEVYRARDPRLQRDVAIKILPAAVAVDPDRLRRFQHEARAVAALSHPNILAVFDVGEGNVPYLVTELLEGTTLRYAIAGRPLPLARAIDTGRQLASGLAAAHARGIVHRDLKPDNVFLTTDHVVKILDFGLAKSTPDAAVADQDTTRGVETKAGHVIGTVGYMSPEQVRGREADARSDIFSFGALLYEMATGTRAFQGDSEADTMTAVLRDQPPDLSLHADAPEPFARIVRRCLEKDPRERFQTAHDLLFALDALSDQRPETSDKPSTAPPRDRSIAVLPFAHLSADADQYFTDGLVEELISALGRLPHLRVASRTSAFRFRGTSIDVRQIGRELRVDSVLEGSVRRAGSRLRVTAQLVDTADGLHIWSERYDREMADVFAIQDDIVGAIVAALTPTLSARAALATRPTTSVEAYDLYLKGRDLWHRRSPGWVEDAIAYFEQVIEIDPSFALAHAGLADCYAVNRTYGTVPAEPARERAHQAITRALALDPSLAEVQFASAAHRMLFGPDWRSAEAPLRRAIAINPHIAEAVAYLGIVLACDGRRSEVKPQVDRACALDPMSPLIHYLVATAYGSMGEFADAEPPARRVLELQPDSLNGLRLLGIALDGQGRYSDAIAALERAVALSRAPMYVGLLGMAYAHAGRPADAAHLLHELEARRGAGEYVIASAPLCIQVGLGDLPAIRQALAACIDDRTPVPAIKILCGSALEAFRTDPAVASLLDAIFG